MPTKTINDCNIYYEYDGKGETLVIISGFAADHTLWEDFAKPLKNHYKVLFLDNRGSGFSDIGKEDYSIDLFAKDINSLLDELNIENAYFFGHSMGSAILQAICKNHPEKVKKSILSGTFCKLPFISQMNSDLTYELLKNKASREIISRITAPWLYSSYVLENKDTYNKIIEGMSTRDVNIEGFYKQSIALKNFNSCSWLSKLENDILILAGDKDMTTPLYLAKEVLDKIKNSKLEIIKDGSHMFYKEKPDETYKIILDFFK